MSLHTKLKVLILTIMSSLVFTIPANALEYQTDPITLDFTFGSVLSISTDGDITIPSLTPGTKSISDSNYKVIVSTNNTAGYTLAATVGCSSGANCYNTKNLVDSNNDDTTTNNFTMIDSATTLTTPGTWGISLDSTADENSTFDTLPLYSSTAKIINQTTSTTGTAAIGYAGTNNTTMRIGAYATTSQLAGTYTNTINFIAVANPVDVSSPKFMQFVSQNDLVTLMPNVGDSTVLYDNRDGKGYYVAHLADGNYWMTQNLDLDLVTDGSIIYDSTNTDIDPATPTNADTGYTVTNGVAKWTPARSSIDSTGYGNITTCSSQSNSGTGCWGQTKTGFASGWARDNNTPYSLDPGDRYVYPKTMTTVNANFYNNGDTFYKGFSACQSAHSDCNAHYMIGNYYNFAAANATNSVSDTVGHAVTDSDNYFSMPNSICPKGWRLAKVTSSSSDFTTLINAYGINTSFNYQGLNIIRNDPLFFVRSGIIVLEGSFYDAGVGSLIWSGSISAATLGYGLYFDGANIDVNHSDHRFGGFGVRCIFDD